MMSANLRISRGRREVGRRFIRLDCAEALFAVPPSPGCLFGGPNVADAVKRAQDVAKTDTALVQPPKAKKSFQLQDQQQKFFRQFRGSFRRQNSGRQYSNSNYDSRSSSSSQGYRSQKSRGYQPRGGKKKGGSRKTST